MTRMTLFRATRRFLQTVRPTPSHHTATIESAVFGTSSPSAQSSVQSSSNSTSSPAKSSGEWAQHSLPSEFSIPLTSKKPAARPFNLAKQAQPFNKPDPSKPFASRPTNASPFNEQTKPASKPASENTSTTSTTSASATTAKPRRKFRPRKAAINLTSNAIDHLRQLLDQPNPQMIRVGVKNRGCSGLTYHLEYVDKPGKFDEEISQDGVTVLIDSKALFSIIGSEMDWIDDKLSSRFVFNNPNSKGQCGCGESFMV